MKKLLLLLAFFITMQFVMPPNEGIKGQVFWVGGDQMPGPGKLINPQQGIVREILIYEKVTISDVRQKNRFIEVIDTEPLATVWSAKDGTFKIKLPAGEYSVFTREPYGLFVNIIDKNGCLNCVVVKPKAFTWVPITLDYEAAY